MFEINIIRYIMETGTFWNSKWQRTILLRNVCVGEDGTMCWRQNALRVVQRDDFLFHFSSYSLWCPKESFIWSEYAQLYENEQKELYILQLRILVCVSHLFVFCLVRFFIFRNWAWSCPNLYKMVYNWNSVI